MWPRMAAVPGGDAPPETSKSQPATPLHSSTAPSNDGGTALRPLSQSAPQHALGDLPQTSTAVRRSTDTSAWAHNPRTPSDPHNPAFSSHQRRSHLASHLITAGAR